MSSRPVPEALWLTQFDLDPLNGPRTRSIISNIDARHKLVMAGFPPDSTPGTARADHAVLFRAEPAGRHLRFLVQSITQPDWEPLSAITTAPPVVKELRQVLNVPIGTRLAYRLTANPTRREPGGGRRLALVHDTDCHRWLERQANASGFALDTSSLTISPADIPPGHKPGHKLTIHGRTFTGLLNVTDTEAFARTITHGIGRGRAYGCGLLTVLRAP